MNDTQLLNKVIEFLDLKDRDALEFWLKNAWFGGEYDHGDMIDDGEGLRPVTEEELAARRKRNKEYHDRMERGDGTPMELLVHKSMQSYIPMLADNIFADAMLQMIADE